MTDAKVYIPQEPVRWGEDGEGPIAMYDFTPALRYGELKTCIPSNVTFHDIKRVAGILALALREFEPRDYLIAVGSPLIIGIAAHLAFQRTGGSLQMLTWDRRVSQYVNNRIDLTP